MTKLSLILALVGFAIAPLCTMAEEIQSLTEIRDVAAQFLRGIAREDDETSRFQIHIATLDRRLRLPDCQSELVAFLPQGSRKSGNLTVGVRCTGPSPWTLYVSANAKQFRKVVILKRPTPRGTKLTADDVTVKERDVSRLPTGYLTNLDDAIGKHLARNLPDQYPLTHSLLNRSQLVRRGQRVTLLVKSIGLEIRSAGTALQDGAWGDRISAKNLHSSRVVQGTVSAPGLIEVNSY